MSHVTRIVNDPFDKLMFLPSMHVDRGFFSAEECGWICNLCSNLILNEAGLFTGEDVYNTRKAKTAFIRSPDPTNQWIYDKFNTLVGYYNDTMFGLDLTGYEYLQYAEYDVEGKHNFHMDMAFGVPMNPDYYRINEHLRKLTIVLMLNQQGVDFEGGDFEVNLSEERLPTKVEMNKGNVLILPSFLLHRVTPITSGVRKTLVTWVIGPKFK